MTTDRQLVAWLKGRHPDSAMAELVRRYGVMLRRAASRLTGDRHAAEDICQATFLALTRRRSAASRVRYLGAWLYEFAVAAAGHWHRADGEVSPPDAAAGPEAGPLPPGFDRTLSRMSAARRAVLVDVGLCGLSAETAAGHLGLKPAALTALRDGALAALCRRLPRRGGAALAPTELDAALAAEAALASAPDAALTPRRVSTLSIAALGEARTSIQVLADSAARSLFLRRLGRLVLLATAAGLLVASAAAAAAAMGGI